MKSRSKRSSWSLCDRKTSPKKTSGSSKCFLRVPKTDGMSSEHQHNAAEIEGDVVVVDDVAQTQPARERERSPRRESESDDAKPKRKTRKDAGRKRSKTASSAMPPTEGPLLEDPFSVDEENEATMDAQEEFQPTPPIATDAANDDETNAATNAPTNVPKPPPEGKKTACADDLKPSLPYTTTGNEFPVGRAGTSPRRVTTNRRAVSGS